MYRLGLGQTKVKIKLNLVIALMLSNANSWNRLERVNLVSALIVGLRLILKLISSNWAKLILQVKLNSS